MLTLEWADEARSDLKDIEGYIAKDNPSAANKVTSLILNCAKRLTSMPYAFRTGRVAGTREYLAHPNDLLVYKVDGARVRVLRVMHSKRQYP